MASAVLAAWLPAQSTPDFEPPVRLKAGEVYIDTGKEIAHSGPRVFDIDGDGKADLVVGNFKGYFQIYRNVGTNEAPVFEAKGNLKADGKDAYVHNW